MSRRHPVKLTYYLFISIDVFYFHLVLNFQIQAEYGRYYDTLPRFLFRIIASISHLLGTMTTAAHTVLFPLSIVSATGYSWLIWRYTHLHSTWLNLKWNLGSELPVGPSDTSVATWLSVSFFLCPIHHFVMGWEIPQQISAVSLDDLFSKLPVDPVLWSCNLSFLAEP